MSRRLCAKAPRVLGVTPARHRRLKPPNHEETAMAAVVYEVVEHAGGWAYRVDGTYSETYRSHDEAHSAAERAAAAQRRAGDDAAISYEDGAGQWHDQLVDGSERPATEVKD